MAELGDTLHKMRLAESGSAISGQVTRIDAFGSFHSGWIGQDFLYELPELFITCDTDFGTIQLESNIKSLPESGLQRFLQNSESITLKNINLENLIGETIYIAPDDDKFQATIGVDSTVTYDDTEDVIFRTDKNIKNLDSIEIDGRFETGLEPKPIDWMNTILTTEHYRIINGTHGWIEVPFEYYGETKDNHFFVAHLPTDETIYWAFETHMSGVESVNTFLSEIGIDYTTAEFEEETVWIKPLRTLHHTNRPTESMHRVDTTEFWVADAKPRKPEQNPTLFEKIKGMFSVSSRGIEVSTSIQTRERRAKSSLTKDALTPATTLKETTQKESVEKSVV